jgi:hypothetical protein
MSSGAIRKLKRSTTTNDVHEGNDVGETQE